MKIKKLEKINNHIRDNRIDFDELNHTYTIDKKFQAISVTQLVNKFFPEFDKEYWAEKESKKTGIKKEKILNKWRELGEKARNLGTELHSQIENYYNSLKYEKSREFEKFINFHDKYISDKYDRKFLLTISFSLLTLIVFIIFFLEICFIFFIRSMLSSPCN